MIHRLQRRKNDQINHVPLQNELKMKLFLGHLNQCIRGCHLIVFVIHHYTVFSDALN